MEAGTRTCSGTDPGRRRQEQVIGEGGRLDRPYGPVEDHVIAVESGLGPHGMSGARPPCRTRRPSSFLRAPQRGPRDGPPDRLSAEATRFDDNSGPGAAWGPELVSDEGQIDEDPAR